MSSQFVCRFCSAELPAYLPNDTCPECGCSVDLPDNNPVANINDTGSRSDGTASSLSKPKPSKLVGSDFGDYRLLEEIESTETGILFRAQQKSQDQFVALKMIDEALLADPIAVDRFLIGVQSAARLDHLHLGPVLDIGEIDGRYYFTTSLVTGSSLAARIAESPLKNHAATELLIKVCEGLEHAHARGVVHGDLNPHHIGLDPELPRLTGFGLAQTIERDEEGRIVAEQNCAAAGFLAPEIVSGKKPNEKTDVYALGATLFATLTGKPPFEGESLSETLAQVVEVDPSPPQILNGEIDKDLQTICLKCLEKDPLERYESVTELKAELTRFTEGEAIKTRRSRWSKLGKWARMIVRNRNVRLRSSRKIAGLPLYDIAWGEHVESGETRGHAKGIIAIGDRATGVIACGRVAMGLFAFGFVAVGGVGVGLASAGVLALGLATLGVWSVGGLIAIGVYSAGLLAIGYRCAGLLSLGGKAVTIVGKVVTMIK